MQHSAAADTQFLGQLLRLLDQQAFLPAGLTAEEADLLAADREGLSQKTHQRIVGLAVDRGCADTDFQPFAMLTGKLGALGAGLQMAVEDQVLAQPVVERHPGLQGQRQAAGHAGRRCQVGDHQHVEQANGDKGKDR